MVYTKKCCKRKSYSDPTWLPTLYYKNYMKNYMKKKEEKRKRRKGRPSILKIKKISEGNGESSWIIIPKMRRQMKTSRGFCNSDNKRSPKSPILESFICPIDAKLIASIRDPNIDISPFESGEFIMKKSDLGEKYPLLLWRIDGKTVLQKFESFELDGKIFYRNKATYAGFCTKNRHLAQRVPVKICQESSFGVIVKFSNKTIVKS